MEQVQVREITISGKQVRAEEAELIFRSMAIINSHLHHVVSPDVLEGGESRWQ